MVRFSRAFVLSIAGTLTALVLSCSSSNSSSGSSSMSATIQGQSWQANIVQATLSNGVLAIAGQSTQGTQVQLRVLNVTQPGTVTIGAGSPHMATLSEGTAVFSASGVLGSGRITFTKLTSQEAEGTFEFTAYSSDGKLTRTVSNGLFNVQFQ